MYRTRIKEHLPYIAALVAIQGILYHSYWAGTKFFTGKDFILAYVPFINFQTDCLRSGSLPLWNPFIDFGFPWVDHYINSTLFPTHLIMGLVTGSNLVIVQREVLCWLLAGGFGMYLCVTELGYSKISGLVAAISFIFSGPLMSLPDWSQLVYNACSFPYLIYGFHRAKRLHTATSMTAILFLSVSFLGGHPPSFVFSAYFLSAYVLIDSAIDKNPFFGIKFLAITMALTALLVLPKLAPFYIAMKASPRMASQEYINLARENFTAINYTNFTSLVLPVKYFFSLYMGELFVLAFIYGLVKRSLRFNALLVLAVLSAWLFAVDNEGQVSALRSLSYFLPFTRMINNEWMYWFFPVIFLILYLSRYLDEFLSTRERSYQLISGALFFLITTIVFIAAYDTSVFWSVFIVHAVLALLWTVLAASGLRTTALLVALCGLLTIEYAFVLDRVNIDKPARLSDGHITLTLTDQWMANKSLDDPRLLTGPGLQLSFLQDTQRPSVLESRHWAYLDPSIDTLDPGRANRIVDSLNQKRFAGYAYNAQPKWEFTELRKSPLMASLDNMPLALIGDAKSGALSPSGVAIENISCTDFTFRTQAEQPAIFLLHQMFDDRWTVFVDGNQSLVLRLNSFFMGVSVPPGAHTVHFKFRDAVFSRSLIFSTALLAGFLVWMCFRYFRKRREAGAGQS